MPSVEHFIEGFQYFRDHEFLPKRDFYHDLATNGQEPKVMMVTCSDARISVQHLTHARPGDLFVLRNVANLVPNFAEGQSNVSTTAALEFAVRYLKVEDIVVMGHSHCGGIEYLMKSHQGPIDCSIRNWVSTFTDARDKVIKQHHAKSFAEQCHECEKIAVLRSIENLEQYPWIKDCLDNGTMKLHAWYYDMGEGNLSTINQDGTLTSLVQQKD